VAIRSKFLPALLGIAALDLDGEFRELLTHGVKMGRIAIQNPVDTAVHVHETSLRATSHLVTSMVDKDAYLNLEDHRECVVRWGQYGRTARLGRKQKFVDARGVNKPAVKRQDILAGAAGLWLSVIPDRLNGNLLSAEEFRQPLAEIQSSPARHAAALRWLWCADDRRTCTLLQSWWSGAHTT
jgi:hypothetical protein